MKLQVDVIVYRKEVECVNNELLVSKMNASGLSRSEIAERLGITRQGLYNKLSGTNEFKSSEIRLLSEILMLSPQERDLIFFADCVDSDAYTKQTEQGE